jgi:hypothetical protein
MLGAISRIKQNSTSKTQDHSIATLPTSRSREVLQSFMAVTNVLCSIAETIPVVGPSIKGALEALYKVLYLVEVSTL